MGENIRSRELDLALFHLNTAIHEKLGDDYVNLSYTCLLYTSDAADD